MTKNVHMAEPSKAKQRQSSGGIPRVWWLASTFLLLWLALMSIAHLSKSRMQVAQLSSASAEKSVASAPRAFIQVVLGTEFLDFN